MTPAQKEMLTETLRRLTGQQVEPMEDDELITALNEALRPGGTMK